LSSSRLRKSLHILSLQPVMIKLYVQFRQKRVPAGTLCKIWKLCLNR
jgi:hypothetical protein